MLLSGAYDETCKTWDVESGKLSSSYDTEGLVQCVGWDFVGWCQNAYKFIISDINMMF